MMTYECPFGHQTPHLSGFDSVACAYVPLYANKFDSDNYCGLKAMPVDPFSYDEDDACQHIPGLTAMLLWATHVVFPVHRWKHLCLVYDWVEHGEKCPVCIKSG